MSQDSTDSLLNAGQLSKSHLRFRDNLNKLDTLQLCTMSNRGSSMNNAQNRKVLDSSRNFFAWPQECLILERFTYVQQRKLHIMTKAFILLLYILLHHFGFLTFIENTDK